jgi:hypothetical protein
MTDLRRGGRKAAVNSRKPPRPAPRRPLGFLVALGEGIRLDQLGRFGHDLECAVGLPLGDASLAVQVMVRVDLHVALGRGRQLDARRGGNHLVHIEAARLLDRSLPQPGAEVGRLGDVADYRLRSVGRLEGFDEGLVVGVVEALEVLHRGIETLEVLTADAQHLVLGHRQGEQELLGAGDAGSLQLLVEGDVRAAHHGREDAVGLGDLDLVDQRIEVGVAERVVLLADDLAALEVLDVLACDLHRGARPDVVRAHQEYLGCALFLLRPVEAVEDLLGGFLAGVDDVLRLLQALVEGGVVEQAVFLLEDRQHGLARG